MILHVHGSVHLSHVFSHTNMHVMRTHSASLRAFAIACVRVSTRLQLKHEMHLDPKTFSLQTHVVIRNFQDVLFYFGHTLVFVPSMGVNI